MSRLLPASCPGGATDAPSPAAPRGQYERSAHFGRAPRTRLSAPNVEPHTFDPCQGRLLVVVAVAPRHQGSGVAADLIEHGAAVIRRQGSTSLRLCVDRDNGRAIAFYRKTGWHETGRWGARSLLYVRRLGGGAVTVH